jgi:hypothetical protein
MCIRIGSAQSMKSDVDSGSFVARAESQKFGGEDSKWKFTTSCANISYNLAFAQTQNLFRNYIRIRLFVKI